MNPKERAYERLRELLAQADGATYDWVKNGTDTEWKRNVRAALRRLFGEQSEHVKAFDAIHYSPSVFFDTTPDSVWVESYLRGIKEAKALIKAAIQEFEDYEVQSPSPTDRPALLVAPGSERLKTDQDEQASKQVFIVHGHDVEMEQSVARFVERLGLEAIVLGEQASGGDTVIEKFERRAGVGFAIILLSPDDVGASVAERDNLNARARQNVILELGYFLGSLKRRRVCPIVRGRLELPSDLHGLVYVPFEADTWKMRLVKELKEAGFEVDANKAF